MPPLTTAGLLYATPTCSGVPVEKVRPGCAATTTVSVRLAVCASASVACRVREEDPAAVGVPLTVPVAGSSVRPAGSEPAVRAQVNGPVPPLTTGVWL